MKSKYPSKQPCYTCGATWKIGDEINKKTNPKTNATYWCSNPNCGVSDSEAPHQDVLNNIPDIEDPEEPSVKTDKMTIQFVKNQNILLDIIEDEVYAHLTIKYEGRAVNGQQAGMRTKIIWDALNKK